MRNDNVIKDDFRDASSSATEWFGNLADPEFRARLNKAAAEAWAFYIEPPLTALSKYARPCVFWPLRVEKFDLALH